MNLYIIVCFNKGKKHCSEAFSNDIRLVLLLIVVIRSTDELWSLLHKILLLMLVLRGVIRHVHGRTISVLRHILFRLLL